MEEREEVGAEAGGFVKVETTGGCIALVSGLGVRIGLNSLEQTIHHATVEVEMGIERRAETVQEAGSRERCGKGKATQGSYKAKVSVKKVGCPGRIRQIRQGWGERGELAGGRGGNAT